MMKKIICIIVMLGMILPFIKAQTLLQGNKMWYNVSYANFPGYFVHTDINKLGNDTVINGLTYRILLYSTDSNLQQWTVLSFLRETPAGQVFFLTPGSSDPERLWYDFNVQVGDTVPFYYLNSNDSIYGQGNIVVQIDTLNIAGQNRKIISLDIPSSFPCVYCECWVEGIGSSSGFIHNGAGFIVGSAYSLNCYFEDSVLLYHNDNFPFCYNEYVGIHESRAGMESIHLYPNPVSDISILKIPQLHLQQFGNQVLNISIYDGLGRCLRRDNIPADGEYKINHKDFVPGVYFYQSDILSLSGKFLIR